jgi:hypothetical protein
MKANKLFLIAILFFGFLKFASAQSGTLTICDDTDDNIRPLKVYTTATTSTPVNFQIEVGSPLFGTEKSQTFIQWETFKVDANGDETPINQRVMTTESGWLRYATTDPYYFPEPGKYAVYAISYYKRNHLENRGYKEYIAKTFIDVTN